MLGLTALVIAKDGPCNGFSELCGRRYSNITFAASHNAAFVGKLPQHNQYEYPEAGMAMGIRYFTTQVHIEDGEIRQCHSDCALLNVGLFSEIVVSITSWLKDHPREVVTLLVTNGDDNILIEEFAPIFEAAGAVELAFVPGRRLAMANWPTLGDLIKANHRLIVFMDYNADPSKVPYILPQFDYYVETPFSPTKDNFFNCDIDRPEGGSSDNRMVFANHNLNLDILGLLLPAREAASETNSISNIKQQTDMCVADHGRNPSVVMGRRLLSDAPWSELNALERVDVRLHVSMEEVDQIKSLDLSGALAAYTTKPNMSECAHINLVRLLRIRADKLLRTGINSNLLMGRLLQVAIAAYLTISTASASASSLPALRIQPLGDSVTKGSLSSHNNGYRGYLRDMLKEQSDNAIDMIGSLRNGAMDDNDHEGHSGHFLAEINEFYKLSVRARPNVVLLHAGTNNMDKEIDLEESPDLIEAIIDGVHDEAPDAAILVMPVIWANDTRMQNNTDHFNKALEGIIQRKRGDDTHILSVPTNLTVADLADVKHPNDRGYKKMAEAWLAAIREAHGNGWLEDPVSVDAKKLVHMGLGTHSAEADDAPDSPPPGRTEDEEDDGNDNDSGQSDDRDDQNNGENNRDSSASRTSARMRMSNIVSCLLAALVWEAMQ
ncbi:hypothetical protein NLU13_7957 [Sarocladium strictum]|uniref:SGNH hydrolase-type esterase domain-containing protein n=1 Tax=Sarocladium strictum TaxID=5046 RepID=A0AA39GAS4_SARSR|nr:hypothetical protein NLU13_7957 [Sarocladium strictum]